jgi:hypothetical protein
MKRNSKPWQEKLDPLCVKYLQVYREFRAVASKVPTSLDLQSYAAEIRAAQMVFKRHPELEKTRKVSLTPKFFRRLKSLPGFNNLSTDSAILNRTADILEMAEKFSLLESFPEQLRTSIYYLLAMLVVPAWDSLVAFKREQFGERPLDPKSRNIFIAQGLETLAEAWRGRLPQRKGKRNAELIRLVKKIVESGNEYLTADDVRNALAAAGVAVAEGETWRIWLYRAEKAALIPRRRRVEKSRRVGSRPKP